MGIRRWEAESRTQAAESLLSECDADFPEQVAYGLAVVEPALAPIAGGGRGSGRTEDFKAARFEHSFYAEDVIAVAYHDGRLQVHAAHYLGHRGDTLGGAFGFALHHDGFGRDATLGEVGAADGTFGEDRVAAGASGGDDARRHALEIQVECVVQSSFKNRRRLAAVFSSAQNDNGVGGTSFVQHGLMLDLAGHFMDLDQHKRDGAE